MRKGFLMVLAVALVAVLAAPAMAGTDINGFYRAKGYVSNFKQGATVPTISDDMQSGSYVEQRLRVRFAFGEENVKVVWFSEIDFGAWGDTAGGAATPITTGSTTTTNIGAQRNTGGALGGDRINLETKSVYVWFKLPNTSLDFTVGLQTQTDTFQGLLYGAADMSGIFLTGKYEPVSYKLGWAKLYENDVRFSDDVDLATIQVNFAPAKGSKLGLSLYYWQDDSGKYAGTLPGTSQIPGYGTGMTAKVYTFGVDGAFNAGPVALSGFALYQFGTVDILASGAPDTDISAFAVDIRGDMNLGPGKLFVEGLYLSGGDQSGTNPDYESVITLADRNASPGGNSFFGRMDYSILMGNFDDINTNTCLVGCASPASGGSQSPGLAGRGIWTIGAGYSMKVAEKTTAKIGVGYLSATEMLVTDASYRDKDMGMEVNANVNYNIMKGLDFGFYAAWAQLGDFYKTAASGVGSNPDDVFDLHVRLNYAF